MIRVSVCMATYNGERFIEEQVATILMQLEDNDELIISDDHSEDDTLKIVRQFDDPRIKIFLNPTKRGYTNNFINALKNAKGEYIFLADQDDIWLPNKVEVTLKSLCNYDFVVSDAITINSELEIISESRFAEFNIKNGFIRNFIKSRYIGCCMAFKSEVMKLLFPFPSRTDYCPHDTWIGLSSELNFKCGLISEPLIKYRRHENNISDGGYSKGRPLIIKLLSRVYCLKELLIHKKLQ